MWRNVFLGLLLMLTVAVAGCGDSAGSQGGVAIVNLDTVLKLTGVDLEISKAKQERRNMVLADLSKFQKSLGDQIEAKQKEFGEERTPEQNAELQQTAAQLQQEYDRARAQANQNLSAFEQEMFQRFMEQVSPVSLEIAKERGYSVVMAQSPQLLAFDTNLDITDAVVERLKEIAGSMTGNESGVAPTVPGGEVPITPPANPQIPVAPSLTPPVQPATEESADPAPAEPATEAAEEMKDEPATEEATEKPATPPEENNEEMEAKPETEPKPAEEPKPEPEAVPPAEKPEGEKPAAETEEAPATETEPEPESTPPAESTETPAE